MRKIAVFEDPAFSDTHKIALSKIANVEFFIDKKISQQEIEKLAPEYDIVVVDWLDPNPFLLNMKPNTLVALLSTGYSWVANIPVAYEQKKFVANIPEYCAESVSEHLVGLLIGMNKNIFANLLGQTTGAGTEIKNKTIGIIGLGKIGTRFAELTTAFGANIITYSKTKKNSHLAKDVCLDTLLSESDIICVTCSRNKESELLINKDNINRVKKGAKIIGSTWNIIDPAALASAATKGDIAGIALDAALEAGDTIPDALLKAPNTFLTRHSAYNTIESRERKAQVCFDNIEGFINGKPLNIIKGL